LWDNPRLFAQLTKLNAQATLTDSLKEGGQHLSYELQMVNTINRYWVTIQALFTGDSTSGYDFSFTSAGGNTFRFFWNSESTRLNTCMMVLASDCGKLGDEQIENAVGVVGRIYQYLHLDTSHKQYLQTHCTGYPDHVQDIIDRMMLNDPVLMAKGFHPDTTPILQFFTRAHLVLGRTYLEEVFGRSTYPSHFIIAFSPLYSARARH